VSSPTLTARLKISLDELRMQVLGAQVLFGFQFQSLFQPGFDRASSSERLADSVALTAILISFATLLVPATRHRLVEAGNASRGLLVLSNHCAEAALVTMSLAFGCITFSIAAHEQAHQAAAIAVGTTAIALLSWFGIALAFQRPTQRRLPELEMVDLHTKIDQMLTEARVILPGVQAMLGFQLIVVMTQAFDRLQPEYQYLHFFGLAMSGLSVVLLIAPAAVHRLAFSGDDSSRFHQIGAALVTAALIPLSLAIAAEFCIAAWKISATVWISTAAGAITLCFLLTVWYAIPLGARVKSRA
jgi:hypothetical protein